MNNSPRLRSRWSDTLALTPESEPSPWTHVERPLHPHAPWRVHFIPSNTPWRFRLTATYSTFTAALIAATLFENYSESL